VRVAVIISLFAGLAVIVAGCSGEVSFSIGGDDPETAAEKRIEDQDFVDQVGLGELTADCNDPGDVEVGDTFLCTAETEDGQTIDVTATIADEDTLNVQSTNLLVPSDVATLEQAAVRTLNQQNNLNIPPGAIDCGDTAVVIPDDQRVPCVLTNPTNGLQYDTVITITDLESGEFSVNVSGQPRA
jgi:hypothetical protein